MKNATHTLFNGIFVLTVIVAMILLLVNMTSAASKAELKAMATEGSSQNIEMIKIELGRLSSSGECRLIDVEPSQDMIFRLLDNLDERIMFAVDRVDRYNLNEVISEVSFLNDIDLNYVENHLITLRARADSLGCGMDDDFDYLDSLFEDLKESMDEGLEIIEKETRKRDRSGGSLLIDSCCSLY